MREDKIFEVTRKAIEKPLAFTNKVMTRSEKLRQPSPEAVRIGCCIGVGLLLAGLIQIMLGKPSWALGSIFAGILTVVSNLICRWRKTS